MFVALLMVGCGEEAQVPTLIACEADKKANSQNKPFTIPDLFMKMLWVQPGTFMMGSPIGESVHEDDKSQHSVTLTEGFWLGKHEVTQVQWEAVMSSNPSEFKSGDRPVERVTWLDATSFCEKLTELENKAGRLPAGMSYQLPTEAQWEYACRAGTQTAYAYGDSLTADHANIDGVIGATVKVGRHKPNAWGFHDMHGNVWEWCADWYGDYPSGSVHDPVGPANGSFRVIRGGSWPNTEFLARSALRLRYEESACCNFSLGNIGFRLSLRRESK